MKILFMFYRQLRMKWDKGAGPTDKAVGDVSPEDALGGAQVNGK